MAEQRQRITLPCDVALFSTFGEPGHSPSSSHSEIHGTGDLVATMAGMVFSETQLHEALDTFLASMAAEWGRAHADRHPVHQSDHVLRAALREAVEEGARIGVALFATMLESAGSWQAWADAARAHLQRSGCDLDAHTAALTAEMYELSNCLRDGQRRQ